MSSPLAHRARFVCPGCGEPFPVRSAIGPIPLTCNAGATTRLDLVARDLEVASIPHHRVDAGDDADTVTGLITAAPFTLALLLETRSLDTTFVSVMQRTLQLRLTPVFLVHDTQEPLPHELGERLDEIDMEAPRLASSLLNFPGKLAAALSETAKQLLKSRQVYCGSCSDWARFDRYLEPAD